jgi:FkbM family methyltransferase
MRSLCADHAAEAACDTMTRMASNHRAGTAVLRRAAGRMRRRAREGVFEAVVRATTISAAFGVTPSTRFALNELFLMRGTRRYQLRRSGRTLFVRHPVTDAWVVHEVVNRRVYQPPPAVEDILGRSESPRIVDLGAHIGAATLLFLERFPDARVLAVEPQPENAALLRKTLAVNRLDGQCEVRQAAAGVAPGYAAMEGFSLLAHFVRSDTAEAVDLLPPLRKYQADGVPPAQVEVVDVLPILAGADLVKMDIEGAEWPILADPRFPSLGITALVLEYHPQGAPGPDTLAAVRGILGSAGYTVDEPVEQHGSLGLVWAWHD